MFEFQTNYAYEPVDIEISYSGLNQAVRDLERYEGKFIRAMALGVGEAIEILSAERLAGKHGRSFSHQYAAEKYYGVNNKFGLSGLLDRYFIQHDQTGTLRSGNRMRFLSKYKIRIYNIEPYSTNIAKLDQGEIKLSAWEWAMVNVITSISTNRRRSALALLYRLKTFHIT